jgi:hypothetical protein
VLDAELMEQLHYHHPQVPPFWSINVLPGTDGTVRLMVPFMLPAGHSTLNA